VSAIVMSRWGNALAPGIVSKGSSSGPARVKRRRMCFPRSPSASLCSVFFFFRTILWCGQGLTAPSPGENLCLYSWMTSHKKVAVSVIESAIRILGTSRRCCVRNNIVAGLLPGTQPATLRAYRFCGVRNAVWS